MKIIKRSGAEAVFDPEKIRSAISRANLSVDKELRLADVAVDSITDEVVSKCEGLGHAPAVEEIQDLVEHSIMKAGAFDVAKNYITYRYDHQLARNNSRLDDRILSLVSLENEEAKQENSNKNPVINSTQRDYMASEVSEDLTWRKLLPPDIVQAHKEGIIHFHDAGYFAGHVTNCELVNLEDMLQNGTVITDTLIEKPHSFSTACNIATQVIAQVASNTYGGQTISLAHLAPFVDISRKKIRATVVSEMEDIGVDPGMDKINEITEKRLRDEIKRGVQTIQYQILTLLTTNGFLSCRS